MSDPTPTPDPSATASPDAEAKTRQRCRCNWHRVRVYFLSIMIMGAMWFGGIMIEVRLHPDRIIARLLEQLPYSSSTGRVVWVNRRTLQIDDVKIGGFFYADSIILTVSPFGLWRHHVAKVQVIGAQLFTKPLYEAMDKTGSCNTGDIDWVIGRLEISRGTVMLDNLLADTSIPVRLGVRHPLILTMLRLGKPDSSPEMSQERTAEIGVVNIVSPIDPVSPVFTLPLTQVTFTYSEIWHHHIRKIVLIRPTMFLGEDLFWLTSELKSEKPAPSQGPGAPWEVGRFEVDYGRLAINAFGQPAVYLPFFFNTKVDDIRLDQLDKISAKSTVNIERLTQDYPDYKARIINLRGRLYFSWPPSDSKANNVVNYIQVDEVSWNDIPVRNVNSTITFDPKGVYGRLNGTCEGGALSGNFEFYYTNGFTWNADFFAEKVNCQPIAEKLAGKYCDLTGELDGKIAVQGKATEILLCKGQLELPHPGTLEIKSMKDLLDRLPSDMIALKRQALTLAIDSFKTYPYDKGKLTIDYTPEGGTGSLKLTGPRGARDFEIYLHPFTLSDNAPANK